MARFLLCTRMFLGLAPHGAKSVFVALHLVRMLYEWSPLLEIREMSWILESATY
jgi:hypothetical protein